ncbi:nitroreductase [Chitinophaga sedimenti]|uniref:nitroreductase family protein n=1 Tax=Chitinophaga sedimenti TaxID=2033606 RepID=UPI002004F192|nr:nitroreductase [Chitinophaga sedimenti]MCK7559861.1 nitroreductase [Chitinophaga sedimenti]
MTTFTEQPAYLKHVITHRRTVKPTSMNGEQIPDEKVQELLQLADWAPTHAYTEPWFFYVYGGEKMKQFCHDHAELYKKVRGEAYIPGTYDKLATMGDKASHVIISCMRRGANPNIPELEEIASAAAATQNLLLGAAAEGISAYWGSGGMAYHPSMKEFPGLREEDKVLGVIYLGYSDVTLAPGKRTIPLEQKVKWM